MCIHILMTLKFYQFIEVIQKVCVKYQCHMPYTVKIVIILLLGLSLPSSLIQLSFYLICLFLLIHIWISLSLQPAFKTMMTVFQNVLLLVSVLMFALSDNNNKSVHYIPILLIYYTPMQPSVFCFSILVKFMSLLDSALFNKI